MNRVDINKVFFCKQFKTESLISETLSNRKYGVDEDNCKNVIYFKFNNATLKRFHKIRNLCIFFMIPLLLIFKPVSVPKWCQKCDKLWLN